MEIAGLVIIALITSIFIAFTTDAFRTKEKSLGIVFAIVSTFSIIAFSLDSSLVLKDGSPVLTIRAGEYKVAFVYQAGDNVSVGIETVATKKGEERLNLYQFKKDAFEGKIRLEAKKLFVIESGSFKRLKLE